MYGKELIIDEKSITCFFDSMHGASACLVLQLRKEPARDSRMHLQLLLRRGINVIARGKPDVARHTAGDRKLER